MGAILPFDLCPDQKVTLVLLPEQTCFKGLCVSCGISSALQKVLYYFKGSLSHVMCSVGSAPSWLWGSWFNNSTSEYLTHDAAI